MAPRNAEASGNKSKPPAASTASGVTESDLIARSKKRRIPGACDICKRKKVRCDSGELPGNRCSNCIQLGLECTHKEVTKTLGSAKGYVESLEARLEKMDKLLRRLLPGVDLNQEVGSVLKTPEEPPSNRLLVTPEEEQEVLGKLNTLTLKPHSHRFFGKSSQYDLLQTALDLREEFTGEGLAYVKPSLPMQRPEFWDVPKWMTYNPEIDEEERNYVFPDDDLYPSLIDAYFSRINPFHPLLHQPTFEAQVTSGLHRRDSMFAKVFLLVCAHGARFSDDPRVLAEGTTSARSSGWKWFEQVNIMRRNLFNRTVLHELQMHALYVLYAGSSEMPQGVWAQIGMALRLSQEVGGHRRRRHKDSGLPTAEDELWKRAFWVILSMDRWISQFSGRPCGLQDEDFDLDLPLEVDDEYWETGFSQPEGQPSSMAYFNSYLSLMDILAYAMRLIYSTKRSKFARKGSERSEQETIAELDAAMNSWMDSVPEHLRWNAQHKSPLFIKQSSALHATYYWLQIFIHRPFIPSPRNPTSGAFPSLAICTNAARSACHVLETFHKLDTLPHQPFQAIIFSAAAILLLNIWSGKRSGFAPNPRRELEDVQRCMDMLRASETRWAAAGRWLDLLNELASAGDLGSALTQNEVKFNSRRKRSRSDTEAEGTDSSSSPSSSMPTTPPAVPVTRNIAGTRRVSISQQSNNPSSPVEPPINFLLPMYSNDLGRLPVYGQFNFSDTANVNAFLGDQLGQIHTSIPTKTSNSYHFDQPPNPAAASNLLCMASDATANYFSDNYMLDSMIKDAVFNSPIPTPVVSTSASGEVASDGTTPRPPGMSAADMATLFAQCSTDFGALTQHLGPFGPHQPIIDPGMMKMWNNAPASLELDEWGTFISNVGQLTRSKRSSPALP